MLYRRQFPYIYRSENGGKPLCPVCEKNEVKCNRNTGECDICQDCKIEYAYDFDTAKEFLYSQAQQEIGITSWTDFTLRKCYGIRDCDCSAALTDLLGGFDADSVIQDKYGDEYAVAQLLADYILENDLTTNNFQNWLKRPW